MTKNSFVAEVAFKFQWYGVLTKKFALNKITTSSNFN